jgi:hypothetical protein
MLPNRRINQSSCSDNRSPAGNWIITGFLSVAPSVSFLSIPLKVIILLRDGDVFFGTWEN